MIPKLQKWIDVTCGTKISQSNRRTLKTFGDYFLKRKHNILFLKLHLQVYEVGRNHLASSLQYNRPKFQFPFCKYILGCSSGSFCKKMHRIQYLEAILKNFFFKLLKKIPILSVSFSEFWKNYTILGDKFWARKNFQVFLFMWNSNAKFFINSLHLCCWWCLSFNRIYVELIQ